MDTITDTQKLEHIKNKNKERQARYYETHREEILQKNRANSERIREMNAPPPPPEIIPTEFTLPMIIDVLTKTIDKPNTLKKYICDMKRIFKTSGITSFTGSLDVFLVIKESLENSRYSLSTIKGSFQSILVFITNSKIVIDSKIVAKYDRCHKVFIIKCEDQTEKRKSEKEHAVIPFTEYKRRILEFFGADSKEYLIASLYNELTARDDFGCIRILRIIPYDNGSDNILFIDHRKEKCHITLNNYKTSNIYGKIIRRLSPELCSLIVSYTDRNRLMGFLFPEEIESGLGAFITDMNKKVGVDSGINGIRHMVVSEFLQKPDLTPEMRLKFSADCMHSESTQQKYRRGVLDPNLKELCDK
jgi:hypothetical protein